jgi:hypothetical protein
MAAPGLGFLWVPPVSWPISQWGSCRLPSGRLLRCRRRWMSVARMEPVSGRGCLSSRSSPCAGGAPAVSALQGGRCSQCPQPSALQPTPAIEWTPACMLQRPTHAPALTRTLDAAPLCGAVMTWVDTSAVPSKRRASARCRPVCPSRPARPLFPQPCPKPGRVHPLDMSLLCNFCEIF